MRLVVYADEPIVSDALNLILTQAGDISLEAVIDTVEQIIPQVQRGKPDLLLLSLTPSFHVDTLADLREAAPECRIVLWTRSVSQEIAHQAMDLGVRGILQRTCSTELLLKCLRKVYEGELWFDRQFTTSQMTCHRIALTPRQAQLAQLVAEHRTNKEIAADLSITEGAVKVYLSHLFEKLGTKDRTDLAELVARNFQPVEYAGQFTSAAKLRALYVSE